MGDAKRQFGRYTLGPEFGSGGMATVSFAVATGALGFSRPVAIKRIHPTLTGDQELRDSIRDEARIAARVRHPNVVAVIDVVDEADSVGIVLEYIHGEALSALLRASVARGTPLPIGVAVTIITDVLHGLHAAHSAVDEHGHSLGIVHRDVSPQNVIVGTDGISRVLDFGISKAEHRATVTRDGQVKGKLRYMAPEQLGGEVSPSVDIYATGLLLWEALTGRSPFHDVVEGAHLVASVLGGVSAKPSSCRSEISPALEAIVAKALDLLPARRFANALEMAAALEATGLAASRTGVAAYVQEFASEVLAARSSVVALLERGMPADEHTPPRQVEKTSNEAVMIASAAPAAKRRRALPLGLVAGASLGLAVLAFALRPGAQRLPSPMGATAEPPLTSVSGRPAEARTTPVPSASASVPLSAPPTPTSSSTQSSPPTGRPTAKPKPKPDRPDCSIPYTVDANGYRSYRRECFQQP